MTLLSDISKITLTDNNYEDLTLRNPPRPHEHPLHGSFASKSGFLGSAPRDKQAAKWEDERPRPHPHPVFAPESLNEAKANPGKAAVKTNLVFDPRVRAALCLSPEEKRQQLRSLRRAKSLADIQRRKLGEHYEPPNVEDIVSSDAIHFDSPQINSSAWLSVRQERLEQEQFDRKEAVRNLLNSKPSMVRAINSKVTAESIDKSFKANTYRDLISVEPNLDKIKNASSIPRAAKVLSKNYLESLENPPPPLRSIFYDNKHAMDLNLDILSPLVDQSSEQPDATHLLSLSSSIASASLDKILLDYKFSCHMSDFVAKNKIGREDIRWESLLFNDWNPDWVKNRQEYLLKFAQLV